MHPLANRAETVRFALVGGAGFAVDAGILTALTANGVNLYAARAISFTTAVATTYLLNRKITFPAPGKVPSGVEAAAAAGFGLIQVGGAAINLLVYLLLIALFPALGAWPVLPLAAGAVTALAFNFLLSSLLFHWRNRHGPG